MNITEKKVQEFFARIAEKPTNIEKKEAIRHATLSQFKETSHQLSWISALTHLWDKKTFRYTSTGASLALVLGVFSFFGQNSIAGNIEPTIGDITLIQDGQTHIIRERTPIRVGDIIHVPDGAKAELTLSKKINTTLTPETEVRVVDAKNLFVSQGRVENQVLGKGKITTARGTIHPETGAHFAVEVSEAGETKVVLKEKSAEVVDWLDGRMVLHAGEQIQLRTDTQKLSDITVPDLKLSFSQVEAIRAKLIIARTKFFTAIEKNPAKPNAGDIASAEKTFRSIVQVLKSDRQLNILKRTNPEAVKNEDVFNTLQSRTNDQSLLKEVRATEKLFAVFQKGDFHSLSVPTKDSRFFNRFSLIDQIFVNEKSQEFSEILKDSYVALLARKIINIQNPEEQLKTTAEEVQKIPQNGLGKSFRSKLSSHIDPYLPGVLNRL